MPWGDGTGPWWAQGRPWRCWRGFPRSYGWRYPVIDQVTERRKLEEELRILKEEKKILEERLKQLTNQQNEQTQ